MTALRGDFKLTEWLIELVQGIPTYLQIIILAAVPVTELRASIPLAVAMGVDPSLAFLFSVLGNILPALPLLLFLGPAFNLAARIPFLERFLHGLLERTRSKGDQVAKYGTLGLVLFVAVPAPGTGVWTGTLLAFLFGIPFVPAFFAILGGAVTAGVLVTLATVGAFSAIRGGYGVILLIVLAALALFFALRKKGDKSGD
jgi:uncharacterized membrane protein